MTNIKFIIFFSTFLITAIASAQNNDVHKTDSSGFYKLTDVVISASKTSSSTLELANSITVIDSAQIINSNQTNVFDLLKSEYGLSVTQPGGQGALSTINIRGSNPEHVLVLIDGIEMNMTSDAANVYDFANLPVEQVNRIEILRGPQSTLYGSDALAGVVNIITNKGT
ncbi:MAG: TonB-dependent receptor, partial [Ignavibacteriaceae bacterium]|nr:TonB-dependent receptor [Ignavibacteriaceae bacterium]